MPLQSSIAVGGEKLHGVPHSTVRLAAQVRIGAMVSRATITQNAQFRPTCPQASVALHVTVFVPTAKRVPEAGVQLTTGAGSKSSVTVGTA